MTEKQWVSSANIPRLVVWDRIQAQDRKVRLFGCACCRQLDRWLTHPRAWKALDASERRADGLIQDAALRKWDREVEGLRQQNGRTTNSPEWMALHAVAYACTGSIYGGWRMVAREIIRSEDAFGTACVAALKTRFGVLLHDIFGNPFRPVAFDPAWRTSTAIALAQQMYESRDFAAMPILADALQDAGCDNDDVLTHCRNPGTHVRGCWLVDLVLGKA